MGEWIKMAFKIVEVCTKCENDCKQEVRSEIVDTAKKEGRNILVSCPKGKRFKKKKKTAFEKPVRKDSKAEASNNDKSDIKGNKIEANKIDKKNKNKKTN